MDYFFDYAQNCEEQLLRSGLKYRDQSSEEIVHAFLNCFLRHINDTPRKIVLSLGFKAPPDIKQELIVFFKKAQTGESIKPYLSGKSKDADFNDLLFNDWMIHHFHIGKEQQDGTIKRADYLLFALVLDDAILCIDVIPHSDPEVWYKKEMVDIAYANWPELFANSMLKTTLPTERNFSNQEIKSLRNKNLGHLLTMKDGTAHMGLGLGSCSNGYSTMAQLEILRIKRKCQYLQEYTLTSMDQLTSLMESSGAKIQTPFDFHIAVNDGKWGLYETQSRVYFNFSNDFGLPYYKLS